MDSNQTNSVVRDGHRRAIKQVENAEAYRKTRDLYREALGGVDVFLRPTDDGFTVLSLDADNCPSMIGVGARGSKEHTISSLPPDWTIVQKAVEGYQAKRGSMKRASSEEAYALRLISSALADGLALGPGFFITQEWRLPSSGTVDLVCADPSNRHLIVIELKKSEHEAHMVGGKKGGNAWDQARSYADKIYQHRQELYPFFERLGRALAQNHDAPAEMRELTLDPDQKPSILVSWPGGKFSMRESSY
ncbi:MAG: hypothetical protein U5L08_00100 [Xanthomonadales bacterium]|nr:hypothetical protein [Xanthomonadales bacterium]